MHSVARLLLAVVLALPVGAQPPAPHPLILVYLAAPPVAGFIAGDCPSGPYLLARFKDRAELDAFVTARKPLVLGVFSIRQPDGPAQSAAGILTLWAPCSGRLGE